MISVVDKYYRRIIQNIDNVRMKFDISALLVKSKEHDSKIETNESNISDNLGKIETNENNISDNLGKIDTNRNNISSNTSLIDTNKNNISSNTSLIDTNKNNISSNTSLIDTNKNNISSNTSLINTNKSNISSNTSLINTNKSNISDNLTKIDTNKSNISDNSSLINTNKSNISDNLVLIDTNKTNIASNLNTLNNVDNSLLNLGDRIDDHQNDIQRINTNINELSGSYKLKDIIIIDIIKSQIPETVDSNNEFVIIKSSLDNLKKDSYIQFDSSILIYFQKHYINIAFFHILLEYFNENDILIDSIKMPIIGMISRHTNITNSCIIKVPNDFDKIYYKLSIKLNEGQNRSDNISILDFDNKIYFKYFEK